MDKKLKAILGLIEAVLAMPERGCARLLWLDMAAGDVEWMDDYEDVDEATEVCAREFAIFATTCERECGEPPANLYNEAHIVLDADLSPAAVITYRKPEDGESEYPVMHVQRGESHCRITAESVVAAASSDAA